MASPLAFRITMQVDDSQLQKGTQSLRGFKNEAVKANVELSGSKKQVDEFIKALKKFGEEAHSSGKKANSVFGINHRELKSISSEFLVFRRLAGLSLLIAAPFVLAAKEIIKTDNELKQLNTSLTGLGNNVGVQGESFLGFIKNLTFLSSTTISEGVEALNTYISKTKDTTNAQAALSAAQVLSQASGKKLSDVTSAIADALNGDATALSNLTLKTKEEISSLVQSGQLTKKIQDDFKQAADQAKGGAFEAYKILGVAAQKGLVASLENISFDKERRQQVYIQNLVGGIDNIKKSFKDLNSSTINFSSLDSLRIQAGKIANLVGELQSVASSPLVSAEAKQAYISLIPKLSEQHDLLQKLINDEQQLSSPERNRLEAETKLLELQNKQLFDKKDLSAAILSAQIQQANAQAISEHRSIIEKSKGLGETPEQAASIEAKRQQGILKAIQDNNIKILKEEELLDKSRLTLQEFYLKNRFRQYSGITEEQAEIAENRLVQKEIEIAVEGARREREQLVSEHKLTSNEEERIENDLQLKVQQIRKSAEDSRAKEAQDRLKNLTESENEQVKSLVNSLKESQKSGQDIRGTLAFKELGEFKKISDARKKDAQDTQDIITEIFAEPVQRKAGQPEGQVFDFINNLDKGAVESVGRLKSALNDIVNQPSLLTPKEKDIANQVNKAKDEIDRAFKENPPNAQVKITPDKDSLKEFTDTISEALDRVIPGKLAARVAIAVTQGPEQGGSNS